MDIRKIVAGAIVVMLTAWLHTTVVNNTFSFAQAFFILPVVVSQVARHRLKLLIALALVAELYTSFPPGIMTAVAFTPWLTQRLTKKVAPDISLAFLAVIAFTITLQTIIPFGYEIISLLVQEQIQFSAISNSIPSATMTMIIGVSTLLAATICIAWREIFPVHRSGSAIFTRTLK